MSTLEWLKISLAQILIKLDTFFGDFEPHDSYNKDSDKKKSQVYFLPFYIHSQNASSKPEKRDLDYEVVSLAHPVTTWIYRFAN